MRTARVPLLGPLRPPSAAAAVFSSFPVGIWLPAWGCSDPLNKDMKQTHSLQKAWLSRQHFTPKGAAGQAHGQQRGLPSTAELAGARTPLPHRRAPNHPWSEGADTILHVGKPSWQWSCAKPEPLTAGKCCPEAVLAQARCGGWGSRVLPPGCSPSREGGSAPGSAFCLCREPAVVPFSK